MSAKKTKILSPALIFIIIAALTGGSVPVAAKYALEVFRPFTVVVLRFFFAALFLFPLIYKKKELNIETFKGLFSTALIGALNPILLFIALQFTKASFSPLIYASVPALTALYLYFFQGKKISLKQLLGIILGLIGVFTIVLLPLIETGITGVSIWANGLILVAAGAFVLYGILSREKQKKLNFSPLALTFYFSLVSLIIGLPLMGYEFIVYGPPTQVELIHILSGVYAGLIGTGVFYLAYQHALKNGSEITASLFTYLQPLIGIGLAALILGESVTLPFVIGGILAIVGAQIASGK